MKCFIRCQWSNGKADGIARNSIPLHRKVRLIGIAIGMTSKKGVIWTKLHSCKVCYQCYSGDVETSVINHKAISGTPSCIGQEIDSRMSTGSPFVGHYFRRHLFLFGIFNKSGINGVEWERDTNGYQSMFVRNDLCKQWSGDLGKTLKLENIQVTTRLSAFDCSHRKSCVTVQMTYNSVRKSKHPFTASKTK